MATSIAVPLETPISSSAAQQSTTADWLCRIRAEYLEVPGLCLTGQQAKRLWALDDVTCKRLLQALVDARFLRCTSSGQYVRVD